MSSKTLKQGLFWTGSLHTFTFCSVQTPRVHQHYTLHCEPLFFLCFLFVSSWRACVCAIIYLLDLLWTKNMNNNRLKHKREVANVRSVSSTVPRPDCGRPSSPGLEHFLYVREKDQIFQNTACSNNNNNRLRLVPLAVTSRRLSMLCYLCQWWVSSLSKPVCKIPPCQHFLPRP